MVQYLISAVKNKNGVTVDLLELFSYDSKIKALEEARSIADGASPTSQALNGFTDVLVHEYIGSEIGNVVHCEMVARFKILK